MRKTLLVGKEADAKTSNAERAERRLSAGQYFGGARLHDIKLKSTPTRQALEYSL